MSKIPLTRGQFLLPFVQILDTLGAPVESLLEKYKLPPSIEKCTTDYLPIRNCLQFAEKTSYSQGISDFGYLVSREANFNYLSERNRKMVRNSSSLFSALKNLCANAHLEDTNLRVFLVPYGNSLRLCSQLNGIKGFPHLEHSQWLQNVLLIHVVREFIGPDWIPENISFESQYHPTFEAQEHWNRSRFHSGQSYSWIDIPEKYLHLPPINRWNDTDQKASEEISISSDLVSSLKIMLPSYLGGKVPTVADIAEMANTSIRSLQRTLSESGWSYRQILNTVKFEQATKLLLIPETKISEIALSLGYTDAAHFTRAFREMAGVSPSQFRKFHLESDR